MFMHKKENIKSFYFLLQITIKQYKISGSFKKKKMKYLTFVNWNYVFYKPCVWQKKTKKKF